jgi:hypothetical protein
MKNSIAKPPAFMIAENPILSSEDGRLFVMHTRSPQLLAELFEYKREDEAGVSECMNGFTWSNTLNYGNDVIVFGLCYLTADADFNNKPDEIQKEKIEAVMRRMIDWYKACLIWQDKNRE